MRKSSRHVTKLSHLKTRKTAHRKLHHEGGVNSGTISKNNLRCSLLCRKYVLYIYVIIPMGIFYFNHFF